LSILIRDVRIIDGKSKAALENGWVLIRNAVIEDVGVGGKEAEKDAGARIIDGRGCTLLPGMMNLHVHIQRRHLHKPKEGTSGLFRVGAPAIEGLPPSKRMAWAIKNAYDHLKRGITTLRDTGSNDLISSDLRDLFKEGILKGPTIISSGEGVGMTGGHGDHRAPPNSRRVADGADEIRKAVRWQLKAGADWIKLMASGGMGGMPEHEDPRYVEYGLEELRAGVEEAHKRWRPVTVHAYATQGIKNSIEAGVDCVEHGVIMDEETVSMMKKNNVSYVPTMTGMYNLYAREKKAGNDDFADLLEKVVIEPHKRTVTMAHKAGVRIGTGTDTLGEDIQEIQMLHECGMTAMEAIQASTRVSAEIVKIQDRVGAVEKGKCADLVVVEGNPLENLEFLRKIRHVFKNGEEVNGQFYESSLLTF